jgi:hypothetical protein
MTVTPLKPETGKTYVIWPRQASKNPVVYVAVQYTVQYEAEEKEQI